MGHFIPSLTQQLTSEEVLSDRVVPAPGEGVMGNRFREFIKRGFDVTLAAVAAIVLLPLMGLIALWVKRDSPGPVLFRGKRMGRGREVFDIYKFRTMYESPESYRGAKVTAQDDPRITRAGGFLRNTKLNELPQLWNVLKGDMSLVGPRPEDPEIAATWAEEVQEEILSVRPGITSPASVVHRNEESMLSNERVMRTYLQSIMPSKVRLDQLYVRHWSLWLDLDVMIWTLLVVVVPGFGTYQPPERDLFLGPVSRMKHRYLKLFTVDLMTTLVAFVIAAFLVRANGPFHVGWTLTALSSIVFALLFSAMGAVLGVHNIAWSKARAADIFDLLPAVGLATLLALGANYWLSLFPSGVILLASALSFMGFAASRYRTRLLTGLARRLLIRRGPAIARERVLIVGGGQSGQLMSWLLSDYLQTDALHVVGYVDDDLYMQGIRVNGISVLGQGKDIPALVEEHDVGLILFAIHKIPLAQRRHLMNICQGTSARVVRCPDFLSTLSEMMESDGECAPQVAVG